MRKILAAALLAATAGVAFAQSPIDGTWKVDLASYARAVRPMSWVVSGGTFECVSCLLPYRVPADGKDHPVEGYDSFDTLSVRFPGRDRVETVASKSGKVVSRVTMTLAADRKSLKHKVVSTPAGAKPSSVEATYERVAMPAGKVDHWLTGSWRRTAYTGGTASRVTFKTEGGALSMSSPEGGESYVAPLDGTPAPLKGATGQTVSVRMTGKNSFEETVLRDGKPVMKTVLSVDDTGQKATVTWTHEAARAWALKFGRTKDAAETPTGSYTMTREGR